MNFDRLLKVAVVLVLLICCMFGCGKQGSEDSTATTDAVDSSLESTESIPNESEPEESTPAQSESTNPDPSLPVEVSYTVRLTNLGGKPLERVRIKIYPDSNLVGLIAMGNSDENGELTFVANASDSYVAVLQNIPDGYAVDACYSLTGEFTEIVLGAGKLTDNDLDSISLSLGSPMPDFTITAPDGSTITMSDLLTEKKVVVLNFWSLSCEPCKKEFPYLEEAYEMFRDDVAVLALNTYPYDTDADISQFQTANGYTFTMATCDYRWMNMLSIGAYPTTVVIDRFGSIALIHAGSVPDAQPFIDVFEFFSADDYVQTFVTDIEQIPS